MLSHSSVKIITVACITAIVHPYERTTEDGKMLEWCQCFDTTGQLIAEGATEEGCQRASLVGEWTLYNPAGLTIQTLDRVAIAIITIKNNKFFTEVDISIILVSYLFICLNMPSLPI